MSTLISALITQSRRHLNEVTANFWSDAELTDLAINGIHDLWGAILDLHQEHFLTVDETNVSLAANATSLTGVPTDVFRVHILETRDLTSANSVQDLTFEYRDYNHADFQSARGLSAQSPSGQIVYFCLIGAGAPVGAPSVLCAPKLTSAVNLRLAYVPTLGTLTSASANPIPGEADQAVVAWMVAYAKAKENVDGTPDKSWLSIYATEKKNLLVRLTPRQSNDPDVAEAFFEPYW